MKIYKSFGSIEGVLKSRKLVHGLCFKIHDFVRGDVIECIFKPSVEFSEIIKIIGERVCVNGTIKTLENGKRLNILVDNFSVFPSENELPKIEEIIGVLK